MKKTWFVTKNMSSVPDILMQLHDVSMVENVIRSENFVVVNSVPTRTVHYIRAT